jgi:hypothetical protein
MNFEITVARSESFPINDRRRKQPEWFIRVLQTAFSPLAIGTTRRQTASATLDWKESFRLHGVRGLKFKFVSCEWNESGDQDAVGFAKLCARVDGSVWLPVTLTNDAPTKARVLVKLTRIESAKPELDPNGRRPVPLNMILCANLAFSPSCPPGDCPIDLSAVAFGTSGQVRGLAFVSEPRDFEGIRHSWTTPTFCFDTFGPTVRIDLEAMFSGNSCSGLLFLITSNSMNSILSSFKWLAVDFYVSAENLCHNHGGFISLNKKFAVPLFKVRVSPAPLYGSTATVACLLSTNGSGVEIQQVRWNAPSHAFRFAPFSIVEMLSELGGIIGFAPAIPRRLACVPGSCCSLSRGFALQGFPRLCPVAFAVRTATRNDVTLSCIVLDGSHGHVESISYNRTEGCNGAIAHPGDKRVGDGENMFVNFDAVPANARFLCFCVNGNQGSLVAFTRGDVLLFSAGRNTDVFTTKLPKSRTATGLIGFVVFRCPRDDWGIFPACQFTNARNSYEARPLVIDVAKHLTSRLGA